MPRILVVEHDAAARGVIRQRLEDDFEILESSDVSYALALALHDKPDAILLDLNLPNWAGYELCQAFASLTLTRLIPIFVMTEGPVETVQVFCQSLSAVDCFQKPVDVSALKWRLISALAAARPERREEVRLWLRVVLRLRGTDTAGTHFDLLTTTEDVSASGFLCRCTASIPKGGIVEVTLVNGGEHPVGQARAARGEWQNRPLPHYGFRFTHKPLLWVLQ
ncbi:MAG: response regulator [Acidipila sp.]|nr:response regulator [Acidipila sp.]